jgi:TPR repeat protein
MMEQGWVYILVNSSIPGLVKVGRTTRPPAQRAAELSNATGVATPFVVAFEHEFPNCADAEQLVHAELDRRGLRLASNREFFHASPAATVRVVLEVAALTGCAPDLPAAPSADALIANGDRHLFGEGETLQDPSEAVHFYRQAAARGSVVAQERLGVIYAHLGGNRRTERRRAMRHLKKGAKLGNYYCYCEMARLFALQHNMENFAKAWDLFFARRADSFCAEAEAGADRYESALRLYIASCIDLNVRPAHLAELRDAAEALVRLLSRTIEATRDPPQARQRLAVMLRWVYENLMPPPRDTAPPRDRHWARDWVNWTRRVPA